MAFDKKAYDRYYYRIEHTGKCHECKKISLIRRVKSYYYCIDCERELKMNMIHRIRNYANKGFPRSYQVAKRFKTASKYFN